MRHEFQALAGAVKAGLRHLGWRWRAAFDELRADNLAREAVRDLCVVIGFLGVVIAAGISFLARPASPHDGVPPQVQAAPEVMKPAATDSWALSPFPLIQPATMAERDAAGSAAPEAEAIDGPEAPRRHRRHHRRRG